MYLSYSLLLSYDTGTRVGPSRRYIYSFIYSEYKGLLYNLPYFQRQHYRHFSWTDVTLQSKVKLRARVTVHRDSKQQQRYANNTSLKRGRNVSEKEWSCRIYLQYFLGLTPLVFCCCFPSNSMIIFFRCFLPPAPFPLFSHPTPLHL